MFEREDDPLLANLVAKFDQIPADSPVTIQLSKGDISLLISALVHANHCSDQLITIAAQSLRGDPIDDVSQTLGVAIFQKEQSGGAIKSLARSLLYKIVHEND